MAWEHETGAKGVRISILLPHRGELPSEFVELTWGPLRWRPLDWCEKIPRMCRAPSLPLARNALAQQALDDKATHLLWVDTDAIPESPSDPNEALRRLYMCDAPIAACLYVAKQKVGFNYAAWLKMEGGGYAPIKGWTGNWFRVDVTGMHFTLIKREVFEKVPKPWFHWEEPEGVSEDFYFWERCREAGFEVKIFSEVKMAHIGNLKVLSNGRVTTLDV